MAGLEGGLVNLDRWMEDRERERQEDPMYVSDRERCVYEQEDQDRLSAYAPATTDRPEGER